MVTAPHTDVDGWFDMAEAMLGRSWNEVCGAAPQHGYLPRRAKRGDEEGHPRFHSYLTAIDVLTRRSFWHVMLGLDTDASRLRVLRKLTEIYGAENAAQLLRWASAKRFNQPPPAWWHKQGQRPKRRDLWRNGETR